MNPPTIEIIFEPFPLLTAQNENENWIQRVTHWRYWAAIIGGLFLFLWFGTGMLDGQVADVLNKVILSPFVGMSLMGAIIISMWKVYEKIEE